MESFGKLGRNLSHILQRIYLVSLHLKQKMEERLVTNSDDRLGEMARENSNSSIMTICTETGGASFHTYIVAYVIGLYGVFSSLLFVQHTSDLY